MKPSENVEGLAAAWSWVGEHLWLPAGFAYLIVLVATTEFIKGFFDLRWGDDHPKRTAIFKLVPQVLGLCSGWYVIPMLAQLTPFASLGWKDGVLLGLGAGWLALGLYALGRRTRPLNMMQVFISAAFRTVFEIVMRRKLTESEVEALDRTQKRPPVEL